jgi:hypothetical protein
MNGLKLLATILLILGLIGLAWGVYVMYEDRDTIDLGRDAEIVFDEGRFPTIGIVGAIGAGLGVVMLIGAGMAGRRSR